MSDGLDRRDFLKQAAAAGLGLSLAACAQTAKKMTAPGIVTSHRTIGPNGKLNVAIVGVNGRGLAHIAGLTSLPGVTVTHICDVDSRALAKAITDVQKRTGKAPAGVKDYRKLLEIKDIDAIHVCTPDHWHTPMGVMALAAGKHVYVEKPCSQNPYEGELLIAAVKRYGGVFQMGNQRRSFPNVMSAIKQIQSGELIGNAYFGRAWYANARKTIGYRTPAAIPAWLGADGYDLWQGPAPRKPFTANLIHYNWHWYWHYGTGEALNNGTHEVDVCRWALGVNFPSRVVSTGGRYHYVKQDGWETPDTQTISWDFAEGKGLTWEGRCCNDFGNEGLERGSLVYGTRGSVLFDGDSYTVYDEKGKKVKQVKGRPLDATNTVTTDQDGDTKHMANFIDCIRSGARTHSPAEEGHKSVLLLHLGNIAWRTGHLLNVDSATGHIKDDPEAMKLWRRTYEPGAWDPTQYV